MDTCILCKSSKRDDIQFGEYLQNKRFGVHTFCLYLTSNLAQNGKDEEDFLGFLEADIKKEVSRISLLKCCYCKKIYANIGCCVKKCRRAFHLICGIEHNAQNLFCNDFRSFCHQHVEEIKEFPSRDQTCLICYENLGAMGKELNSVNVILTPCCRNGWFHKLCLQTFAKTAGYFFKCPLCNDIETFREKLPAKGIYIPDQDAAWELEPNAFAELLERPNECCATNCKNRKGRKATSTKNPFVFCITCGSTAIHRQCLSKDVKQFYCADCTVAFEEGDSGRESLNSHVNGGDNEDEYIDVCHVSDKEDFEILTKLIDTNTRVSGTKRDSGSHTDESDEEIPHSTRNCKKIRRISASSYESTSNLSTDSDDAIKPVAFQQKRRISSDTSGSELIQGPKNRRRKTRIRSETDRSFSTNSENEEAEVVKPKCKVNSTRFTTASENGAVSKCKDHNHGHKKSPDIFNDSDSDYEKMGNLSGFIVLSNSEDESVSAEQKGLDHKTSNKVSKNVVIAIIDSDEDDDDDDDDDLDSLEYFSKIMEQKNNIGSISLRTKNVKNHLNKLQDLTTKENEQNEENVCKNKVHQVEKDLPMKRPTRNINLKSPRNSTKKESSLDMSCIAKRTRRKTIHRSSNNMKTERQEQDNPLNISCIALRTRRKTICAQTNYSKEKYKTNDNREISTHDNNSEQYTDLHFIANDGYEEKISDISCIANRTRRRKSLITKINPLSHIEALGNNTSSTNSTSTLFNSYRSRRCDRHISCYTSKAPEISHSAQANSAPGFPNIKNKTIARSLLLDKFPQQNYIAFLRPNFNTKFSC